MPQSPTLRSSRRSRHSQRSPRHTPGKGLSSTRLTTVKTLCAEPDAGPSFALFLAQRIQKRSSTEKRPKKSRELVDQAVKELKPYLTDPRTDERKARLTSLCTEDKIEQDEYKRIGWNIVRMLRSLRFVRG